MYVYIYIYTHYIYIYDRIVFVFGAYIRPSPSQSDVCFHHRQGRSGIDSIQGAGISWGKHHRTKRLQEKVWKTIFLGMYICIIYIYIHLNLRPVSWNWAFLKNWSRSQSGLNMFAWLGSVSTTRLPTFMGFTQLLVPHFLAVSTLFLQNRQLLWLYAHYLAGNPTPQAMLCWSTSKRHADWNLTISMGPWDSLWYVAYLIVV